MMKNSKAILFMLLFVLIYVFSLLFLPDYYLFEWTARHYYLGIWLAGVALIYLKKEDEALALAVVNIVAILVGQFLGDYLQKQNMLKITDQLDNEAIYQLSKHHGVLIWIMTIVSCMIIFEIVKKLRKQ